MSRERKEREYSNYDGVGCAGCTMLIYIDDPIKHGYIPENGNNNDNIGM